MVRSPRSCEGTPLKAAPTVVCARTSLAVAPLMTTRAGSTVHARYGRTACHCLWLVADKRSEGHSRHAPHTRGIFGVGARMKVGGACVALQVPAA